MLSATSRVCAEGENVNGDTVTSEQTALLLQSWDPPSLHFLSVGPNAARQPRAVDPTEKAVLDMKDIAGGKGVIPEPLLGLVAEVGPD